MDDKNSVLEKLKAAMDEAERVDMSSVKIGVSGFSGLASFLLSV
ncbi:hypothetical protein [Parabacteroides distasonis]|nr:hypothetical protein [Parabacteroides distasonis]